MSLYTNPIIITLRNFLRLIKLSDFLGNLVSSGTYEERYDKKFLETINAGDCVWDVGANIGYYTIKFSKVVKENGKVFAFEPSSINFSELSHNCKDIINIELLKFGLGMEDKTFFLEQGNDPIGATSKINENSNSGEPVSIHSAKSILDMENGISSPNVIKIDVEGHELDVLKGFADKLSMPSIRSIGVEVHSGLLQARGIKNAPILIENLLKEHNFKVEWTDYSHLIATRN